MPCRFILNMIYQIQESSNQCPHCSRHRHPSNDTSSEGSQSPRRIVIPLKKHVLQQNQNIQAALNLLHKQVDQLKQENKEKERQIFSLQSQLSKQANYLQENSQPARHKKQSEPRREASVDYYGRQAHHEEEIKPYPADNKLRRYKSSNCLNEVNYIEHKIHEIKEFKNERIRALEEQLEGYRQICEELKARLDEQAKNTEWMEQFCLSFCNMAAKISKMQGYHLGRHNSLRENTKFAWKFFKSFVKEVIQ